MEKKRGPRPAIYTIGHSNHTLLKFVELLKAHKIKEVIDVRTVPKSRHNPQFNEERLAASLKKKDVAYRHSKLLGGFRHANKDSKNTGWHNLSFRGYADYMGTEEFVEGLSKLEKIATKRRTAIMCAEAVPWRCHRSLIGDALTKDKWNVFDIMSPSSAPRHRLTSFLRMRRGKLSYPGPEKYEGRV